MAKFEGSLVHEHMVLMNDLGLLWLATYLPIGKVWLYEHDGILIEATAPPHKFSGALRLVGAL